MFEQQRHYGVPWLVAVPGREHFRELARSGAAGHEGHKGQRRDRDDDNRDDGFNGWYVHCLIPFA